jgi:hypothetical protein
MPTAAPDRPEAVGEPAAGHVELLSCRPKIGRHSVSRISGRFGENRGATAGWREICTRLPNRGRFLDSGDGAPCTFEALAFCSSYAPKRFTPIIGRCVERARYLHNHRLDGPRLGVRSDPHFDPGDLEFDAVRPRAPTARAARRDCRYRRCGCRPLDYRRHKHRRRCQGGLPCHPAPGKQLLRCQPP